MYHIIFLHVEDASHKICPHVTVAYIPPQEKQGQRLSLCVYPEPVDEGKKEERDGSEDDRVGGGGGRGGPLGLIVEARLNGAGAGKVSAQRVRQRRKYCSCMEGQDT